MILYIDTTQPAAKIAIYNDSRIIDSESWNAVGNLTETLLVHIDRLFAKNQIVLRELSMIVANPGPGSFTGLRIGITTANALAFALNIPVLEATCADKISHGDIPGSYQQGVKPKYGGEPKITCPKSS